MGDVNKTCWWETKRSALVKLALSIKRTLYISSNWARFMGSINKGSLNPCTLVSADTRTSFSAISVMPYAFAHRVETFLVFTRDVQPQFRFPMTALHLEELFLQSVDALVTQLQLALCLYRLPPLVMFILHGVVVSPWIIYSCQAEFFLANTPSFPSSQFLILSLWLR